jgi:hypothetical protein
MNFRYIEFMIVDFLFVQRQALSLVLGLLLLVGSSDANAAIITVDAADGAIHDFPGSGAGCSISEAIHSANYDAAPNDDCVNGSGDDIIQVAVPVTLTTTIDRTDGSNGTPSVTSRITLDGVGGMVMLRDPMLPACTMNGTNEDHEFRLLHVASGGNLTIKDLSLENGCADGTVSQGYGGAIFNRGSLVITNSILSNSLAYDNGGALYNDNSATVTRIVNSVFSGNAGDLGGGIHNDGAIIILENSTLSDNSADHGGGISNLGTVSSLIDSTLSGNSVNYSGGGIYNEGLINTISNSTFSGNSANQKGGGIYNYGGTINTIINSTFSGNSALIEGGGIQNLYYGTIAAFTNNIITNSTNGDCVTENINYTPFAGSNNLIDNIYSGGCPASLRIGAVTNFSPTLVDNGCVTKNLFGGCVKTHAILAGSNALDAALGGTETDQRGFNGYNIRDIGAFERQQVEFHDCPQGLKEDGFTTTVSNSAGLLQAMACANGNGDTNPDTIQLTANISLTGDGGAPTGIFLAEGKNGTPSVDSKVVLNGQGHTLLRSSFLNCNLNGTPETGEFRLLHIGSTGDLNVQNLVFENGCADDDVEKAKGGALFNQGKLSIFNTTMINNQAHRHGGGLFNDDSANISSVASTTFTENFAGRGGGIYISGMLMALTNCTFSGNSVSDSGGAIFNSGTISEINNCTFSSNTAEYYAGGVYNIGNLSSLTNTIITNSTGSVLTDCYSATSANIAGSNNLFDNTVNCGSALSIGSVTNLNPVLSDNGCTYASPSGCVMTHALLAGSNALDAAVSGTSFDQRGYAAFNGRDIGAWESADQDSDGLGEADEEALGTDPTNRDTDDDTLSDKDEVILYGTNPLKADTDGDGYLDGIEVKAGTDPTDPDSYPSGTLLIIIKYLLK